MRPDRQASSRKDSALASVAGSPRAAIAQTKAMEASSPEGPSWARSHNTRGLISGLQQPPSLPLTFPCSSRDAGLSQRLCLRRALPQFRQQRFLIKTA